MIAMIAEHALLETLNHVVSFFFTMNFLVCLSLFYDLSWFYGRLVMTPIAGLRPF